MSEIDIEPVIEAVARAMCQVNCGPHGSPDDPVLVPSASHVRGVRSGKAWELFRIQAMMHMKATIAMKHAMQEAAK